MAPKWRVRRRIHTCILSNATGGARPMGEFALDASVLAFRLFVVANLLMRHVP
jgi:hypothetical protein